MNLCLSILRRELALAWQRPAELARHALFFVMVAALFPLSLRPDPATLALLGPGVLWAAALLAVLLACGRWFDEDLRSGWLDQCQLAAQAAELPLALPLAVRFVAQWLLVAGPVLLAAPLVALQFDLQGAALAALMVSLLLGSAVLVQLAGVAAALAAGLRGAGLLSLLMVLPLATPALVLGTLAVHAAQQGQPAGPALQLLAALLALASVACPWLGAVALKQAVGD
ncbi:heme exporter protein CcmB [Ideonella azotifigens]|uniref:Heme exporter protein B n=1 Tax=Ideonella azotifigens TaxID=513160 RepID=A0ABN1KG37_9BURK|nr:heme exporter protein CcmB [Ideonella azotifigens]MCD2340451.1 heme exporter protein CcmB [Ideonella azotifigens]